MRHDILQHADVGAESGASGADGVLLTAILDGIEDRFYAVDREWRLTLLNRTAERHFGLSRHDVLGRTLWEVFPGAAETPLGRRLRGLMESRETVSFESDSIVVPDRYVEFRVFAVADGLGICFRDVTARKRADERQALLINELNHRVKNTLATVQSIAAQSFRGEAASAARESFEARLLALSKAHDVLTRESWGGADLRRVIEDVLAPLEQPDQPRFRLEGPAFRVPPSMALSLAMAVHELAVNAAKYGALSTQSGRVAIRWTTSPGPASRLALSWEERGGPPVIPPTQRGFGSRLVEKGLARELAGIVRLNYAPEGVTCLIDAPLATE